MKLVTKRRKSNNQIVLNCLHQHNLITIEGRTKLFSAIPQPTKILYLMVVLFALFLCSHSVAYKKAPLSISCIISGSVVSPFFTYRCRATFSCRNKQLPFNTKILYCIRALISISLSPDKNNYQPQVSCSRGARTPQFFIFDRGEGGRCISFNYHCQIISST